jgi:hypothetical protein
MLAHNAQSALSFSFQLLGQRFRIECCDVDLQRLMLANWGQLATHDPEPAIRYRLARDPSRGILLERSGQLLATLVDEGDLLSALEHDVVVELQHRRRDLYFLHAAAAEFEGQACLLVARSGAGKSTTIYGLLQHGFGYLSDELAPIELPCLHVHGYAHALCLKQPPPAPYQLPAETVRTTRAWHIPTACLPRVATAPSYPVTAIFFIQYKADACRPDMRAVSSGESAARLYANALNQLAHTNVGLNAAGHIASGVRSFVLETADLPATCSLIRGAL